MRASLSITVAIGPARVTDKAGQSESGNRIRGRNVGASICKYGSETMYIGIGGLILLIIILVILF